LTIRGLVDGALEATVVGSFTRLGYDARRRLYDWTPLDQLDLDGRTAIVTGATSGLGHETAGLLAALGAHVCVVGRDAARTESVRRSLADAESAVVDLSSLAETHAFARDFTASHDLLDVLVLNAGALTHEFTVTDEGYELTLATQVLSQFLLIRDLLPLLEAAPSGRVIVVASGGMYLERLDVDALQPSPSDYDGVRAYSRAKRAQVALAEEWTRRLSDTQVTVNAMHPGWADTPGLRSGLPGFSRALAPLLRTPRQGADTIAWLAAAPEVAGRSGLFFLDRRARPTYRRRGTRRLDEAQERARLWELCQNATASFNGRDSVI
jgi:NAD(P)-dependent dehydrogenase (short-subunit alcohol dehydrogenase family)